MVHKNQENTRQAEEPKKSSYASLFKEEDGFVLKYVAPEIINGKICAKIKKEDVVESIEYWKNSVICCILGANPSLEVMNGYLRRVWRSIDIDQVLDVKRGIFIVKFKTAENRDRALTHGFHFFDNKPLIIREWNEELNMDIDSIATLLIWVTMHDLPFKFWSADGLSKIASMIGVPIKMDRQTRERTKLGYAKILVEMPLDGPFPEYIDFLDHHDTLIRQPIHYDWKPTHCTHCRMYGHEIEQCRKKLIEEPQLVMRTSA